MVTRKNGPNLLVTGTPGTGKTSTCQLLAEASGLRHLNVNEFVKANGLHSGWDEEFGCHVLDEDKLLDELEDIVAEGGVLVDYHGCELFPERWFDLVVVLRTDNSVLYDRLALRGYSGRKLEHNMEAEIMQVLLEEARENYKEEIVKEMQSNTVEDIDANIEWIKHWLQEARSGGMS